MHDWLIGIAVFILFVVLFVVHMYVCNAFEKRKVSRR